MISHIPHFYLPCSCKAQIDQGANIHLDLKSWSPQPCPHATRYLPVFCEGCPGRHRHPSCSLSSVATGLGVRGLLLPARECKAFNMSWPWICAVHNLSALPVNNSGKSRRVGKSARSQSPPSSSEKGVFAITSALSPYGGSDSESTCQQSSAMADAMRGKYMHLQKPGTGDRGQGWLPQREQVPGLSSQDRQHLHTVTRTCQASQGPQWRQGHHLGLEPGTSYSLSPQEPCPGHKEVSEQPRGGSHGPAGCSRRPSWRRGTVSLSAPHCTSAKRVRRQRDAARDRSLDSYYRLTLIFLMKMVLRVVPHRESLLVQIRYMMCQFLSFLLFSFIRSRLKLFSSLLSSSPFPLSLSLHTHSNFLRNQQSLATRMPSGNGRLTVLIVTRGYSTRPTFVDLLNLTYQILVSNGNKGQIILETGYYMTFKIICYVLQHSKKDKNEK
ncbi:hypothetical protein H1C71_036209 [Ictidomys tridecemlineatus]|nr:hypothetical protein H1C71_036209 [Ictidomys tridecemlineatus]